MRGVWLHEGLLDMWASLIAHQLWMIVHEEMRWEVDGARSGSFREC